MKRSISSITLYLPAAFLLIALLSNCQRDALTTNPSDMLEFSTDTLTFDTVFTTRGSITRNIRVFNRHSKRISIAEINLAGLSGDQYRINVDGTPAKSIQNVEIPAKDSIWIFVEVTVDPMDADLPFVITDEIEFMTNGNLQKVLLQAWGQDANFIFGERICDEVWTKDRPYVIVGNSNFPGAWVDTLCVLTIEAGTRIFLHRNAGIFVSGTIKVMGTEMDSVVFEGDRLERFFDDLPAQWIGIFLLRSSTNNEFNYAVINEADYAISAGSSFSSDITTFTNATRPDVIIRNSILKNAQINALFGFNATVSMENSLVYNSNDNLLALGLGGAYNFVNCTFYNAGSAVIDHKSPILLLGNAVETNGTVVVNNLDQADFVNCILYGSLDEELAFGNVEGGDFNFSFDHCALKTAADTTPEFTNNIVNMNPEFEDASEEAFNLAEASPCIDAGIATFVSFDIRGSSYPRPAGTAYDIGAYERQ